MSQKKVDHYKEQKANRKKIIKKEKRMLMLEKTIGTLVCLALVCWIGFSIYNKATAVDTANIPVVDTPIDISALQDYTNSIDTYLHEHEEAEDAAEEVTEETEEAAEEAEEGAEEAAEAAQDTETAEAAEETTEAAAETEEAAGTAEAAEAEDTEKEAAEN